MTRFRLPPRIAAAALAGALALAGCASHDPAQMVASAKDYLAKSDVNAAIIQLKNALQEDSRNGEARLLLARALLQNGDAPGAEIEARKAVDLHYDPNEAYPVLAAAVLAQGDYNRIAALVPQGALTSEKARGEIEVALGAADLARDNVQGATRHADEAAKLLHDDARVLVLQARIAAAGRDLATARTRLDAALAKDPGLLEATLLKAQILAAQNDRAGAVKVLESEVAARPRSASARLALVPLLLQEGKLDAAGEQVAKLKEKAPKDLRVLYSDALYAYAKGDAARARDVLQRVLAAAPDNLPSMLLLGMVQYQLGSYSSAEDVLARVVARVPGDPNARRVLAATYVRTGRPAQALAMLAPLMQSDAADTTVWATAGEAALANGDTAKAGEYFERAASLDQHNVGAQVRLAQVRLATGDADRAFHDLETLAASDAGNGQADLALIAGHMRRREYDKALAAADALVQKQPKSAVAYGVRGSIYLAKRDLANARASFEKAFALEPRDFRAAYNLALLDVREGQPEAARKRYDAMLAKDPGDMQVLLAEADLALLTGGTTADARKLVQRAVDAHPTSAQPRLALVNLAMRDRDVKAALAAAEAAQAALPSDPQVIAALATAQGAAGNTNAAVETFRRAAQAQPRSAEALVRLAQAQAANHDLNGGIDTARKATTLQPGDATAWLTLAKLMLAAGRPDDALAEARRLQQAPQGQAMGLMLEGEILAGQGKWPQAATAYRKAYAARPVPAIAGRAYSVLVRAGATQEAAAVAERWNREHPKDVTLRIAAAEQSQARKDVTAAVAQYRSALEIDPDNVIVLNNLAWLLQQNKDPAAYEYAERAYRLAPFSPAVLDTLGLTLIDKGDAARGTQLLRMASNLSPRSGDIRLHLGRALANGGDKSGARRELEPLLKLDAGSPLRSQAEQILASSTS
jgi:putative PEP-CTERM system TPR-repeat lipoprotein